MPKKAFPILLILVGAALVLGALLSWFDNLTAAQPVGLGKWVFDVLQFLLGAAGTGLGAWLNFGRKDKTPPANRITNIGSGQSNYHWRPSPQRTNRRGQRGRGRGCDVFQHHHPADC
jgi:hypothetical protein